MIVSDLAVKKRTSVMVLALMILIFGPLSYFSLPRESAPDITIPFVFIMTNYAGVAPEDIENAITIPIENGRMALGTWQGIYLGEHRDFGGSRQLTVTLNGE